MQSMYRQGTIIQIGIICKKIPCYMCDLAYMWRIFENAEIFMELCSTFLSSPACAQLPNLDWYIQISLYMPCICICNCPIIFFDQDNKTKLVTGFFLIF